LGLVEMLKPLTFPSRGSPPAQLEGVLHFREGEGDRPTAVVCHPPPLGGGSMDNAVVTAIASALAARGVMTLRFNFRGVGRSGGEHDNGRGEQADVAGALDWLLAQPGVDPGRVWLAGYSFGAWVGLSHAQRDPRIAAVAAVGLVAWHYSSSFYRTHARLDMGVESWQYDAQFLRSFARPKLFITGEHDSLSPPDELQRLMEGIPGPSQLHVLAGADHSLRGNERQVGILVADFLTSP
jgi:alpha/beta superfamily hydrolase